MSWWWERLSLNRNMKYQYWYMCLPFQRIEYNIDTLLVTISIWKPNQESHDTMSQASNEMQVTILVTLVVEKPSVLDLFPERVILWVVYLEEPIVLDLFPNRIHLWIVYLVEPIELDLFPNRVYELYIWKNPLYWIYSQIECFYMNLAADLPCLLYDVYSVYSTRLLLGCHFTPLTQIGF